MKAIKFPLANFCWKGWPASEEREEVFDLWVYRVDLEEDPNRHESISCWQLSFWERVRLLFSKNVWLTVIGHHPPVCVDIKYPFEVKE